MTKNNNKAEMYEKWMISTQTTHQTNCYGNYKSNQFQKNLNNKGKLKENLTLGKMKTLLSYLNFEH